MTFKKKNITLFKDNGIMQEQNRYRGIVIDTHRFNLPSSSTTVYRIPAPHPNKFSQYRFWAIPSIKFACGYSEYFEYTQNINVISKWTKMLMEPERASRVLEKKNRDISHPQDL